MHSVAGIGDLMLTTLGGSSRNKKVGYDLVASGKDLEDILDERRRSLQGVAEGVATAPAAARLALRLNVRSPLIETANSILQRDISPSAAVERCACTRWLLFPSSLFGKCIERYRSTPSSFPDLC